MAVTHTHVLLTQAESYILHMIGQGLQEFVHPSFN